MTSDWGTSKQSWNQIHIKDVCFICTHMRLVLELLTIVKNYADQSQSRSIGHESHDYSARR